MSLIHSMAKYVFAALLVMVGVTYFTRTRLATVDRIHPEALREPVQTPVAEPQPIRFTRNGYAYEATPLYDYQISGLVVHRLDYWFSIDTSQKAFSVDLCLIWGSNLDQKVHQERSVSFSQDCRWCWVQWQGNVPFNVQEMSNNHLLVERPEIDAKLKRAMVGDQVKLRGKLVNVNARLVGKAGRYDSTTLTWNNSTTRTDTGAGACEVIYLEDVDVLQPANQLSRILFRAGLVGLALLAFWWIVGFFRE